MKEMKEMLEYQNLDIKAKKMEDDLSSNEDRQNALKMQQYLKDCQAKILSLVEKASSSKKAYATLKKVYDASVASIEKVSKSMGGEDEAKLESISEANDAIIDNLQKLEKEFLQISKNSTAIANEYNAIMKNARTAKMNMEKYKTSFNEVKSKAEIEIKKINGELEKIASKIDKTMLAKYKSKRNEKMPVFVKESDGRCGGCRMEISVMRQNKLKADGFIECENCGRIIYCE